VPPPPPPPQSYSVLSRTLSYIVRCWSPPSQNLHFNIMLQSSDRIKWTIALDENSLRLASLDAPRLPHALFKTLQKIFPKNKGIRKGAGEKSYCIWGRISLYMRNCANIYSSMRKDFHIVKHFLSSFTVCAAASYYRKVACPLIDSSRTHRLHGGF
jgi:hypothetical protein